MDLWIFASHIIQNENLRSWTQLAVDTGIEPYRTDDKTRLPEQMSGTFGVMISGPRFQHFYGKMNKHPITCNKRTNYACVCECVCIRSGC